MSTITFDTLKFVEKLEKAGLPRAQAAAIVEAQKEAFSEALENQLASHQDILKLEKQIEKSESALRLELADIRKEQAVQRWMLTVTVGGIVALVAKAFFQV
jgi:phosphopantetheinyl transferase (holo-ACP synthase)